LNIRQIVVSDSDSETLWDALDRDSNPIDLATLIPGAPPIPISFRRKVYADAFGHLRIPSTAHYGMPSMESLFATQEDIAPSIAACREELGLILTEELGTHLGGFDRFEMRPWHEKSAPYGMEVKKAGPQPLSDGVSVWRRAATEEEIAHLVLKSDGEIVFESAVVLLTGQDRFDWPLVTLLDWFELSIFRTSDGALVYRESHHFIREIGLTIASPGSTILLSDDLAKRASGRTDLPAAAARTTMRTGAHSVVGLDPSKLRAHSKSVQLALADIEVDSSARWFEHGLEGEIGAISYLNELIGQQDVQDVIIADPYFGSSAIEKFLLRVRHGDRTVTVVASWAGFDPDTARENTGGAGEGARALKQLEERLDHFGGLISPRFRFVNLTDGRGQAFHDRYLLLSGTQMRPRAFLLSNSINGMSRNWPFCVSEIRGEALRKASAYIQGLADGKDVTEATKPSVNFIWPKTG